MQKCHGSSSTLLSEEDKRKIRELGKDPQVLDLFSNLFFIHFFLIACAHFPQSHFHNHRYWYPCLRLFLFLTLSLFRFASYYLDCRAYYSLHRAVHLRPPPRQDRCGVVAVWRCAQRWRHHGHAQSERRYQHPAAR